MLLVSHDPHFQNVHAKQIDECSYEIPWEKSSDEKNNNAHGVPRIKQATPNSSLLMSKDADATLG